MKLHEIFSSFVYHQPKDKEQILYDFYFLVGYVYGVDFTTLRAKSSDRDSSSDSGANPSPYKISLTNDETLNFIMYEAVKDCVDLLTKHFQHILKYCASAEFKHFFDSTRLWAGIPSAPKRVGEYLHNNGYMNFSDTTIKFILKYKTLLSIYSKGEIFDPDYDISRRHYRGGLN